MNIETLEDGFGFRLQRAYYVERTHVELLAEMAADAASDDPAEAFASHRDETERQVDRLERVFAALDRQPRASRSRTVDGFAESRRSRVTDGESPPNTPISGSASRRSASIRTYEGLLALAARLAYADDIVEPLEETLGEERAARRRLEGLEAETSIVGSPETGRS